ncbi:MULTISPECIES: hypothetical protein [unclassified Microcoleus]|uniref:hypothetical protein n=1 Tax=unclassified Microcoleus TaxID=2642155 RepID=UPI002FD5FE74
MSKAFQPWCDRGAIASFDLLLILRSPDRLLGEKIMQATNQEGIINLTIHYTNGKQQHFQFSAPEGTVGEQATLGTRLHKMLTADPVILELADKLVVIPVHNIQSIEISPVPPKLPEGVLYPMREIKK